MPVVGRAKNDLLLELRNRPGLVDALRDLGLSQRTADRVADAFPDGRGLEDAGPTALERFGATPAQARRVAAAFNVVRVCDENCRSESVKYTIRQPQDIANLLQDAIGRQEQEYFAAILLDSRQRVVDVLGIAVGSLAQVDVHPRELFREAVRRGAHSVILAHNHPSGDPQPSEADISLTERMVKVGQLVGIPVLDHVIVTREGWVSTATEFPSLMANPAPLTQRLAADS
jgi:DNA repair protein RadC